MKIAKKKGMNNQKLTRSLRQLEIGGRIETIQPTDLLRSATIL